MQVVLVLALTALAGDPAVTTAKAIAERGFPAVTRPWTGADYELVASILAQGKAPLPTLSDDAGKAILLRLTATENFSLIRDRNLPIGARVQDLLKTLEGSQTVLRLYLGASAGPGAPLREELASLMAFAVHVAGAGCELIDEFVPTIPIDDQYEARMRVELRRKFEADLARFEGEDAAALKRMIAGLK